MEPIDQTVEITLTDLDFLRAILNSAYNHSFVVDMVESYRKLNTRANPSNLTKTLQNGLTLVMAYIEEAEALANTEEIEDEQPVSE